MDLRRILQEREPFYTQASMALSTSGQSEAASVAALLALLA